MWMRHEGGHNKWRDGAQLKTKASLCSALGACPRELKRQRSWHVGNHGQDMATC